VNRYLVVLAGGALGTVCRYFLSTVVYSLLKKPTFPWANLIINVTGSFAIGLLAELFDTRLLVSPNTRIAVLTGVLGGYTTFSSFSYETYALIRDGEAELAALNVGGSILLGLGAVWAGIRLAQNF
jgi:CrcB protein